MIYKSLTVCVAVLALCLAGSVASADMMTFDGTGLHETVKVHAHGTLADGKRIDVGQLLVTYQDIDYEAYCVDINHYVASCWMTERGVDSLNNGDMVAFLFETYSADVTTGLEAAALGVSIWEVINETASTFDITDGYFSISHNADVTTAANNLLASLPGSYASQWDLTVLHNRCKQDMLIGVVPEPATLTLIGLGGLGLLLRRRRS